MIQYTIGSSKPSAHYFDVSIVIQNPDPAGQVLRLPAWIPGSYMIRDFARNVVDLSASSEQGKVEMKQLDKSSWQLSAGDQPVQVDYRVYAWDLSVRSAHLDTTHGFFNGTSVFLEVLGQSEKTCQVIVNRPQHKGCEHWRLATTMPRKDTQANDNDFSFGLFEAESYEALIDYPVEMGAFHQLDFSAGGIRHDVILTGRFSCDGERLKNDLTKVCNQHINMFGQPAPMSRYMFLVMVVGDGYGGLEHRDSTSLLCSRYSLPQPGQDEITEQYREFLGLCSHEYFHSWNVKRIMPSVYLQADLSTEVYTPLLWAFEGITSYYDDLALVRSGCIEAKEYLELLARIMTRVLQSPGRFRQSVAESSFNAWTKFYKQDENAANSIVSYYAKGSLVALCVDLRIRNITVGRKSLDDVMRVLWSRYQQEEGGVSEQEIQQVICEVAGEDISDFLHRLIYQTEDLPLHDLLDTVSVALKLRGSAGREDKGGKEKEGLPQTFFGALVSESDGGLQLISVVEDGPAQQGGLSAQDVIIAINGLRADMQAYNTWLRISAPASRHNITAFRRDELMTFEVELDKPRQDTVMLEMLDMQNPVLRDWLNLGAS